MQLLTADIDRKHETGAIGEQDLGEAAGRCADVETDMTLDIDRVLLQRAGQLDPAARDKGMRGLRLQYCVGGDGLRWLCHRLAIGRDQARFNGSLRPSAALEQSALDQ